MNLCRQNTAMIAIVILLMAHTQSILAQSKPLQVNDKLTQLDFHDQFERQHRITNQTQILLFAADKTGGKLIHAWVNERNDNFLNSVSVYPIIDTQNIPSLLAKMFAIPMMRKYSYSLLLINSKTHADEYPGRPNTVTIIRLENLIVSQIQFASSIEELKAALP